MAMKQKDKDLVPDTEKARLLDQQIDLRASERYALEAAELGGEEIDKSRAEALDKALADLHDARSKLDV